MIDTHAHLNDPKFDSDRDEVLARVWKSGIQCVIDVTEDLVTAKRSLGLFQNQSNVWSSIGYHPHRAAGLSDEEIIEYTSLASLPKVVAVGEIGLDYYYENQERSRQRNIFEKMLDLALQVNLPVIIHSRDADADLFDVLRPRIHEGLKGVMHCYTGSLHSAQSLLEMGLFISFSGIVTFKNAEDLRQVVNEVPLDRILLETDCPYLAPVPMRGKRNEPSFMLHTADIVARLKGISVESLMIQIFRNAKALFAKIVE